MSFRLIAAGIVLSTLFSGTADACLSRRSRCCRPTKCQAVERAESCKTCEPCAAAYGETSVAQGSYSAFAGPGGIYGVNTLTGQVYKYEDASGRWEPFKSSIP